MEQVEKLLDNPDAPASGYGSVKYCEERLRSLCILMRSHNGGHKPDRSG